MPGRRLRVGDQADLGPAVEQRVPRQHPDRVAERPGPVQPASPEYRWRGGRPAGALERQRGVAGCGDLVRPRSGRPYTTSTVTSSGLSSPSATADPHGRGAVPRSCARRLGLHVLDPDPPARPPSRAASRRPARARARTRAPSVSARRTRAAGTYSSVTYSPDHPLGLDLGPERAQRVPDPLHPAQRDAVRVPVVEQRRHRLAEQVVQGRGLELVPAAGVGHAVGRRDGPAVAAVVPLVPPAVPDRQVERRRSAPPSCPRCRRPPAGAAGCSARRRSPGPACAAMAMS